VPLRANLAPVARILMALPSINTTFSYKEAAKQFENEQIRRIFFVGMSFAYIN